MEKKQFTLEITTPQKNVVYEDVEAVTVPGSRGSFQVLFSHAPLMSKVEIGEVKIRRPGGETIYATSGGFFEVSNNRATLLVETLEKAEEIDVERAEAAAQRAKQRIANPQPDIDISRAEAALARALNRLRISRKKMV
ncbi:MAG: F0F1 ATP synthase subunit epsilon [Calditrichia bacterium]